MAVIVSGGSIKYSGVSLTGIGEYVDIAPNLWLSAKTYGSIDSLNTWTFRSKGEQTRVTMTIDYEYHRRFRRLTENTIVNTANQESRSYFN